MIKMKTMLKLACLFAAAFGILWLCGKTRRRHYTMPPYGPEE